MPGISERHKKNQAFGQLSWTQAEMKAWFVENHLDWDSWARGKDWNEKRR